jgi:membrane protease YdiL (CAAX protease family)
VTPTVDLADAAPSRTTWKRWPGWTVLAWLVLLGVAGYMIFWPSVKEQIRDHLGHTALELQGRYLVGSGLLYPSEKPALLAQSARLDNSNHGKLASITLAGELGNPEDVSGRLAELDQEWASRAPDDPDRILVTLLTRLYHVPAEPLLADERAFLLRELGWFGKLALTAPAEQEAEHQQILAEARRTALVVNVGFLVALSLLVLGVLLLSIVILRIWKWSRKGTLPGLRTGSGDGGVYAETFALWLLFFVVMSHAARWLPASLPHLLVAGVLTLASLSVLVWPWLRGIPWQQLRGDVGLMALKRPGFEVLVGLGCYLSALPLLLTGVALSVTLQKLGQRLESVGPDETPSHPALDWLVNGDWSIRLQTLFVAAVVAPIVEEVFFRGVFYRHLRELTARLGRVGSVAVSALVVSFLFAAIHPQGLFGIPPLMALAFAFTIAREWRGTLVPNMVAHALNNSMVTLAILAAVG